jgi:outer membrane biosynthesis protein TonB
MNAFRIFALMILSSAALAQNADRGSCPPPPEPDWSKISKVAPPPPALPINAVQYLGTVGLWTTVSERGYVCKASVIRSVSRELDKEAIRRVMEWRFRPARIGRDRVATVIVVNVPLWTKADGALVSQDDLTVESPPGTVARKP